VGLEQITTVHYTKRSLGQLSAACKWAMKHGILAQNPYEGMANEMPKHAYQVDPKPNAFTEAEREQVIRAYLEDDRPGFTYQHYAPIVTFLFLTGCRPSEAIGLQWKHVSAEFDLLRFETSITTSGRGKRYEWMARRQIVNGVSPVRHDCKNCSNRFVRVILNQMI
jgi:integrase